jgi:uncharacterized protein YodC (DUF2158 family)
MQHAAPLTRGEDRMTNTFNVGDIVTLKSGGPKMTVTKDENVLGERLVWTTWFAGSKNEIARFPAEALVIAPAVEQKSK